MLNDAQQPADYDYCFVYYAFFPYSNTQPKLKCSDTSKKVIKMLGEKGVTAEYPATWSALLNNKGYAVRGK